MSNYTATLNMSLNVLYLALKMFSRFCTSCQLSSKVQTCTFSGASGEPQHWTPDASLQWRRKRRFPPACLPRQHSLPPHPQPASCIQVTFLAFGRIRLCNFLLYTKGLNLLLINLQLPILGWITSLYVYLSIEEYKNKLSFAPPNPRRISNALSPRVGNLIKMLILIQQIWLASEILHAIFKN